MPEKKRTRPTWEQVRKLEAEIAELKARGSSGEPSKELIGQMQEYEKRIEEQIEGTSNLVRECDAWREKYNELCGKYDAIKDCQEAAVMNELREKNSTLEESVKKMKKELSMANKQREDATADYNRARREVLWLYGRNLWDRITNKRCAE